MKGEERSLHFAGRLLRRSEAEQQMRRPAPVGMTSVAEGRKGAKVLAASVTLRRRPCLLVVQRQCEVEPSSVVKFAREKRNDTSR